MNGFSWQMALNFDYGHWAYLITFFIDLNVGYRFYEVAQSYEEELKVLQNLNITILLIFLLLLEFLLILNPFSRQDLLSSFFKIPFIYSLSLFFVVSLNTVSSGNEIIAEKNGLLQKYLIERVLIGQYFKSFREGLQR